MAKSKEEKFDKEQYAEDVKAAQEEAATAEAEPVSNEIFQSEWDLMLLRRGQDDANLLFDIIEEHGAVKIVDDPEPPPEEEQTAIDSTYEDAEADTGRATQKAGAAKK